MHSVYTVYFIRVNFRISGAHSVFHKRDWVQSRVRSFQTFQSGGSGIEVVHLVLTKVINRHECVFVCVSK